LPHINIQNTPLYYEETGKGFPIVCLHGLGLSHVNWRGQVDYFSDRFRVITYDARGHGRSGTSLQIPADQYLRTLTADLKELLDYLGIEKAHFLAYSSGTVILLHFLLSHSERCERAVLTGAFPKLGTMYRYSKFTASYLASLVNATRYEAHGVAKVNGANQQQVHQFKEQAMKVRRSETLLFLRSLFTYDITTSLSRIQTPILLVYGENERKMMKYRHTLLTSLPRAEACLLPRISHACPTKACDTFNRIVEDFLLPHGENSERKE
jgi:pimeloyl-ACP methyl ester carboxylesterase